MEETLEPRLATVRLRLRPVALDDLGALHDLWTDAEVRRYLWDDQVIPRERVAAEIDASIASFDAHRFGMWRLALPDSPRLVGFCGLRLFGEPEEVEVVYGLATALWGRGLATEAAREVLRYGFERLGLARIFGRTDPPNLPSRRVLERLGMTLVREHRIGEVEVVEYVIERRAFRGAAPAA
jgi:RimJ/RimL family protein N-acetyltransferase